MGKIIWFAPTPGCEWKIDRRILFVEYESMTGEHVKARFDLSAETEYILDGYKTLSFDEVSKPDSKLNYFIKKIVYFEKECNSMAAFIRGCKQNRLFIPTRIEFDTVIHVSKGQCEFISDDLEDCEKGVPNTKLISPESITPNPMRFRGKTWTHPESSYGKKGHMLTVDISSNVSNDDYLDVEIGDAMWYDDGCDGKSEPDDHGKLFVWLGLGVGWKKLSDDNGYFDTDMTQSLQEKLMKAVTNSWSEISFSDRVERADFDENIIMRIKQFEEEIKMAGTSRFDMCKPAIKNIIFNDQATIIMWSEEMGKKDKTVSDVWKTFTEDQKNTVYFMIGKAIEEKGIGIPLPTPQKASIHKIVFNGPATVVFWTDGTKTIVRYNDDTETIDDREKAVFAACAKKLLGTNATGSNYLDRIKPAFDEAQEEWAKRIAKKEADNA